MQAETVYNVAQALSQTEKQRLIQMLSHEATPVKKTQKATPYQYTREGFMAKVQKLHGRKAISINKK